MPDITNNDESLVIVVDVETKEAKKKLKQWNKELAKAADDAARQEKLLEIANKRTFLKKAPTEQKEKYKNDIKQIQQIAKNMAGVVKPKRELGDTTKPQAIDKLLGKTVLETSTLRGGKKQTKIRTEEISKGVKTIREYAKLADNQFVKLSETTSEVGNTIQKKLGKKIFGKIGENAKKSVSGIGNTFKRFGSIITYRVARVLLSAFTNAFKQGIELLSQDNLTIGAIKDTFSSISTTMQVSLTTIMIPLFESLANVLEPLANDFLDFANALSYSNAKLNGQSQYFELSKEKIDAYTKSLKNSNKQLSQLDKFATLNGTQKADLGGYVDVDEASEEVVKNEGKYENIIEFLQKINDFVGKILEGAKDVFDYVSKNANWLVPVFAIVVTAMNPLLGIFGSLITLMSDASGGAKLLAAGCMTLATAMIGVGIAKTFMANPIAGLAIGATAGALAASIFSMVGDVNNGLNPFRAPSLNYGGTTSISGSSDLSNVIESATAKAYSTTSATTVQGNVYIDGQKAGKIMSNSVFAEATRTGVFSGGKK